MHHLTSLGTPSTTRDELDAVFDCCVIFVFEPVEGPDGFGEGLDAAFDKIIRFVRQVHHMKLFDISGMPVFYKTGLEKFMTSVDLFELVQRLDGQGQTPQITDVLDWTPEAVLEGHQAEVEFVKSSTAFPEDFTVSILETMHQVSQLYHRNVIASLARALVHLRLALCQVIPFAPDSRRADLVLAPIDSVNDALTPLFSPMLAKATAAASSSAWATSGNPDGLRALAAVVVSLKRAIKGEQDKPEVLADLQSALDAVQILSEVSFRISFFVSFSGLCSAFT